MSFRYLYKPLKQSVRSYFRFHVTSKIEDVIKDRVIPIQKRLNIKKPLMVNKESLSSNIVFRTVSYGSERDLSIRPKNCVLFFPHLNSPPEIVEKICSVYHDFGIDVVTVIPKKSHLNVTENGRAVISELVNKLSGNNLPLNVDKFLVHAVLSGAFLYALLSNCLSSWTGTFNASRIKGQIFDGLVLGDPSTALSTYRSSIPRMFASKNDSFEDIALDFANSPLRTETLVYHSFDNALSPSAEALIDNWRKKKLDVCISSWKKSTNEDNYSSHPIKYTRTLESFLVKIGFA